MKRQPVLFIGHGSPMNVISDNHWTQSVSTLGHSIEKPDGIVVVSAHWLTEGTLIHSSPHPKTIHDFRGFPKTLYDVHYPAPGSQQISEKVKSLLPLAEITNDWGFDHGTWGVLNFLRPQADIPVVPVSLNAKSTSQDFYNLGKDLKKLRDQNILILGSGNLVHNLMNIDFNNMSSVFPWARDFDSQVKLMTESGQIADLLQLPKKQNKLFMQAHPTSEHWAPYLVCLGAVDEISQVSWIFEGLQNGSISMRSARFN